MRNDRTNAIKTILPTGRKFEASGTLDMQYQRRRTTAMLLESEEHNVCGLSAPSRKSTDTTKRRDVFTTT